MSNMIHRLSLFEDTCGHKRTRHWSTGNVLLHAKVGLLCAARGPVTFSLCGMMSLQLNELER
jgi:hypothetical protein